MTDKQIIEVVSAHMDGKQIQQRSKGTEKWNDTDSPNWNFYVLDYRVKPKNKYRPFKDADEAFQEAKKHGFWVKDGNLHNYQYITFIGSILIFIGDTEFRYNIFLTGFTWADDGTPCGVLDAE